MVRGPIEIVRIFIIIISLWGAFSGSRHAQKVVKLCRKFKVCGYFCILEKFELGVAKWLNSAPWNAAPRFPHNGFSPKSGHRCIVTSHEKKSQGALWKKQQEVRHFEFRGHFSHIPHFFFDVLVVEFSSDQLQIQMSVITTRLRKKLIKGFFFRHTVWPWRGVKVWFHAIKTRASVSRTYMVQSSPN